MSGDIELKRAKRIKYYHTSHKSQFDGNETQHVKGDLAASIDGAATLVADSLTITADAMTISAPVSVAGQTLSLNGAKNILRTEKFTVGHAMLTKTASQYVKIYRASPGDTISHYIGNVTASFGLTATPKAVRISVGQVDDTDGFAVIRRRVGIGWGWTFENVASKGVYFKNASGGLNPKTYKTGANVRALFSASAGGSGMFLASLNKGSIDFYLDVMSRA